jgi:hypothetical protein
MLPCHAKFAMTCTICQKLKHEIAVEDEQQAKGTLEQWSGCLREFRGVGRARYQLLEDGVQASRKRRAALSQELSRHMLSEHLPNVNLASPEYTVAGV